MTATARVAAIGECMAEVRLQAGAAGRGGAALGATVGFGGDTLNFAVYLARQGVRVDYVTALGDDPLSDWMLAEWRKEGVGCELVRREEGAATGLYLIDVDGGARPAGVQRRGHHRRRLVQRRLSGRAHPGGSPGAAAERGNAVAAQVVQHAGAIVPAGNGPD